MCLHRQGKLSLAEQMYRRCDSAGDTDRSFLLGAVLDERGAGIEAEEAYRRADQAGDDTAPVNLGVLRYKLGDIDGAREAWQRAAQRGQGLGSINLAVLSVVEGNEDAAAAARDHAHAALDHLSDGDEEVIADCLSLTYPGELALVRVLIVSLDDPAAEDLALLRLTDDGSILAD